VSGRDRPAPCVRHWCRRNLLLEQTPRELGCAKSPGLGIEERGPAPVGGDERQPVTLAYELFVSPFPLSDRRADVLVADPERCGSTDLAAGRFDPADVR
jgi:hypothetical protein